MTAEAALFSVIFVKIELRIDIVPSIAFLPFYSRTIKLVVNLAVLWVHLLPKQNATGLVDHLTLCEFTRSY